MANSITVTTAQLKNKASDLKNENSKLNNYINTLISTEASLNKMWDGEANDAFHKAFESDIKQMQNFHTAIEKYITALTNTAAKYEQAEKKNVSTATTRKYR